MLNDVITSLGDLPLTITRTPNGSRVNGRWQPAVSSTIAIRAGIEPVTGRELKDMPEGQRGDEVIRIYSAVALRTRTPDGDPDVITYRGEPWTVTRVEVWDGLDQPTTYVALAVRAPSPAGVVP